MNVVLEAPVTRRMLGSRSIALNLNASKKSEIVAYRSRAALASSAISSAPEIRSGPGGDLLGVFLLDLLGLDEDVRALADDGFDAVQRRAQSGDRQRAACPLDQLCRLCDRAVLTIERFTLTACKKR